MRIGLILTLSACVVVSCVGIPRPECSAGPGAPAIAITLVYGGDASSSRTGRELQLAAWPDGRLIWAIDPSHPDAGRLEGRIEPESVEALLEDLCARGVFVDDDYWSPHYGPDGDYVVIQIVSEGDCIRLRSWHELFEARGADVISHPERDRRFLAAWTDIRMTVQSWIPEHGVPYVEPIDLKGMW